MNMNKRHQILDLQCESILMVPNSVVSLWNGRFDHNKQPVDLSLPSGTRPLADIERLIPAAASAVAGIKVGDLNAIFLMGSRGEWQFWPGSAGRPLVVLSLSFDVSEHAVQEHLEQIDAGSIPMKTAGVCAKFPDRTWTAFDAVAAGWELPSEPHIKGSLPATLVEDVSWCEGEIEEAFVTTFVLKTSP